MCTPRWCGSRSTEQEISAKTSFSCGPRRRRIALLDAAHAGAREADADLGLGGLEIGGAISWSERSIYAQTYQGST